MYDGAIDETLVKKNYRWKMSICQHPMYLLIDEDRGTPTVGERVPPWGAADAPEYVERIKRNLDSLEKIPGLRIDYDFSSVELDALCKRFPEVYRKMKEMYKQGKLDFLNGTYSQPHLQVLGSESNWRQFELGLKTVKDLFGKDINVYLTQETGLHEQLPQILKSFRFNLAALPAFYANIEIISGKFELGFEDGPMLVKGDEFVEAVALDGTSLPVFLGTYSHGWRIREGRVETGDVCNKEIAKDLYSGSPVWRAIPDMMEIDQEAYDAINRIFDIESFEKSLAERVKDAPPRAKARVYTYWSYIEGVWADELLRKNKQAEENAILAEALNCIGVMSNTSRNFDKKLQKIWQTILKYQHHDVYWIEVTDLRRKAINSYDVAIENCRQIMKSVARTLLETDKSCIAIFNALPQERHLLVESDVNIKTGNAYLQEFKGRKLGFVDLPAGGYKSYEKANDGRCVSREIPFESLLATHFYRVELTSSGLMKQIWNRDGQPLLSTGKYLGGLVGGLVSDKWFDNTEGKSTLYEGDVAYVIERSTKLGHIPLFERYFFFRNENLIKAEVEFDFKGDTVGNFWVDETKINIYYPTNGSRIYHDIPYGYIEARERRPLFAINWLYCGGLVYVNRGNCKHWIKDGVIANVIAWGGDHFNNRMHMSPGWTKFSQKYDLRPYGKQRIEYYLIPYGEFDGNRISKDVCALTFPVFMTMGKGERTFYEIEDEDLVVTSIHLRDDKAWIRGYKLPSESKSRFRPWQIFDCPLNELSLRLDCEK